MPTLADTMTSAVANGISVIPLRENKRPGVPRWEPFISTLPTLDQVLVWATDLEGFAVICGGATRLEVLDFEFSFTAGLWEDFMVSLRVAGLWDLFDRWVNGYCVTTPGGGLHVAVHLIGDGNAPGNTKLATREGVCLVETRGHGGYVVGPGSNGRTHPNGGSWEWLHGDFSTIEWATPEEWEAVLAVIRSFGDPEPPEPAPIVTRPGGVTLGALERTTSWIDGVEMPTMAMVLEHHGWTYSHSDFQGTYWVRPGKNPRAGHSASVNLAGRFHNWSSNAPVPVSAERQTHDVVDVIFAHETGRWPDSDERVEVMRRWRPAGAAPRSAEPGRTHTPTADPSIYLERDFWQALPWLSEIYDVAIERLRSPEALLGAVLSAYSLITPMPFMIPAIVGVPAPLNQFSALVSRSGRGKSSTMRLAKALVDVPAGPDFLTDSLRSGEGLIAMARANKPKEGEGQTWRRGIQVSIDEVKNLSVVHSRQGGGSALAYLSSAWSGAERVGGYKAAGGDSYPADLVRTCVVMGVQFRVAGELFTGEAEDQGFPGRFMYFGLENPLLMEHLENLDASLAADLPHPLDLRHWSYDEARQVRSIEFPDHVVIATKRWELSQDERSSIMGQQMMVRLRAAALMSLMSGHVYVSDEIWELSGLLEAHSVGVRDALQAEVAGLGRAKALAAGKLDYARQQGAHEEWIRDRAARLAAWVHASPSADEGRKWREIKDRLNGTDRKRLGEIVDYGVMMGWLIHRTVGPGQRLLPGPSQPVL